jgi:Recombinase
MPAKCPSTGDPHPLCCPADEQPTVRRRRRCPSGERLLVEIDGANVIITAVKAHANRAEALKASVRIREKLRVRDEQGTWTGQAPFGYKNQRQKDGKVGVFLDRRGTVGVIVPDENEHPLLLALPQMFLDMGSYNAVATELNRRLVPGPTGKIWEAHSVRNILKNPVYRGVVLRGRQSMTERAGSIVSVAAKTEDVRRYEHPELKVWADDTVTKLDALMEARSRTTTWSVKERKHLASSFVRCPCGGSICVTSSRKGNTSYACSRIRSKGCSGHLGYRSERAVDAAVITACFALLTDEVIARTREIIAQALDVREQRDTRIRDHEHLTREIAQAEKRARGYEEMAADSEGEERARHRASLREQLDRRAAAREQLRLADAQEPAPDPKALLAGFDARVAELRATLARGGMDAMPAVAAILQGQRLTAHRRPDKRWDLRGETDLLVVVEVVTNQKAKIHGTVPAAGTTTGPAPATPAVTPATAPAKTGS